MKINLKEKLKEKTLDELLDLIILALEFEKIEENQSLNLVNKINYEF